MALRTRERERADILGRLENLDGMATPIPWDEDVRADLRARLTEWDGLLAGEPVIARQILRKLLRGG